MDIKDKYTVIMLFVLIIVVLTTLYQINKFMPIINSCNDDFRVIDSCGCIPWNYSLTFPQYFDKKIIVEKPNG